MLWGKYFIFFMLILKKNDFNLYFVMILFLIGAKKKRFASLCRLNLALSASVSWSSYSAFLLQSWLRTFAQIFSCENYYCIFLYFLLNWASLSLFLFLLLQFLLKANDSATK